MRVGFVLAREGAFALVDPREAPAGVGAAGLLRERAALLGTLQRVLMTVLAVLIFLPAWTGVAEEAADAVPEGVPMAAKTASTSAGGTSFSAAIRSSFGVRMVGWP